MASIQSLGVGSGLLTSELVEQIIDAERAPVEARLNNKQAVAEAKIAAFGEVTTALSAFDASLQSLRLPSTFNASQVDSTDATITAADVYSGTSCTYPRLSGNTGDFCTGQVKVPSSLAPGTYYLGAIADDLGQVIEHNKTNNSRAAPNTTTLTPSAAPARISIRSSPP